jgi:hypothetical protein
MTRHSQRTFPCIHRASLGDLVQACGLELVGPVGEDWLIRNDLAALIGTTPGTVRFLTIWNGLVAAMEAGTVPRLARPVLMERRRHGRIVLPCLHRGEAQVFRDAFEASRVR